MTTNQPTPPPLPNSGSPQFGGQQPPPPPYSPTSPHNPPPYGSAPSPYGGQPSHQPPKTGMSWRWPIGAFLASILAAVAGTIVAVMGTTTAFSELSDQILEPPQQIAVGSEVTIDGKDGFPVVIFEDNTGNGDTVCRGTDANGNPLTWSTSTGADELDISGYRPVGGFDVVQGQSTVICDSSSRVYYNLFAVDVEELGSGVAGLGIGFLLLGLSFVLGLIAVILAIVAFVQRR